MDPANTLVLTAAPGWGVVTEAITHAALPDAADARWLAPGDAWEARLGAVDQQAVRAAAERAIAPAAIDVNIVPGDATVRRKRLLCADMESTIIEQELIDEIAGLAGCRTEIEAVTAATMRGELDFEASLVRRVALFAGLEAQRLDAILDGVTLMPGAATLVATMRAHGAKCALISGGFSLFAERIAERLGFDAVIANALEIENGRLTGRVHEPILGPKGKACALTRLLHESGLLAADALAVGDGANDVAMLATAGLGVAFRAKPVLVAQARAAETGAVITHGDLTALLYLQGYTRDQLVSA